MIAAFLAVILIAADWQGDLAAAQRDYASLPKADQLHTRYTSLAAVPGEIPADLVQRFWLPHLSSQQSLQATLPQHITGTTAYRIDLRLLNWTGDAWLKVLEKYPYEFADGHHQVNPLMVRGDWLIRETAANDASYAALWFARLGGPPKNLGEFQQRLGFKLDERYQQFYVLDAGKSGVALDKAARKIQFQAFAGGDYFNTFDNVLGLKNRDALDIGESQGKFAFDAQEAIVYVQKIDAVTQDRVAVPVYALHDGKDKRQAVAPTNIVIDHSGGLDGKSVEVINPASCVKCHATGPLRLPPNAIRELIVDGVEILSKDKAKAADLERLYLGKLDRAITRGEEDFAAFAQVACGCEPAKAAGHFGALLKWYESPVDLSQAAVEVYAKDATELQNAIAYAGEKYGGLPIQVAKLGQGGEITRQNFEAYWRHLVRYVQWWRAAR